MTPVIRTIHRGNSRYYINHQTGDRAPGVTSVIDMLPRRFLMYWSARMAATAAVDNLPLVTSLAGADRPGAIDYLSRAHSRYTRARARVGSDAHDLFERTLRGEDVGHVHPDMEPYRAGFAEFLTVVQPELIRAEDTVWSHQHSYAGSFDAILRVRLDQDGKVDPKNGTPTDILVDWKTGASTYPDVALQMAAYRHADRIISPDGASQPMPAVGGACVLHITPDGWRLKAVRTDEDVYSVFLALRHVFDWERETSRDVWGAVAAESARRMVTGTQRRS